ncbi:MAG: T9SS type A sorting domain-containing protein [Candidatus Omnitrophica bacterium]|nr:T9SS type A sorting domain-containing protein [Candidatus Omnitrophota bacterium]
MVEFDGDGLISGIYFYRIWTGQNTITKKMMLLK